MHRKLAHLFKKYFVPHEHNEYKPHILRFKATIFILALVVLAEFAFLAQTFVFTPGGGFLAQILESVLIEETNASRSADNVQALEFNPLLSAAAVAKAEDMAEKSYFAHTSPEGITPWYWLDEVGYKYSYAGENLAVNFSDSKDVVGAWMNSPGHKANILNNRFTEIGIGTAKGIYQNKETVFIVQFFGKPAEKEMAVAVPAKTQNVPAVNDVQTIAAPSEVLSVETAAIAVEKISQQTLLVEEAIVSPRTRTQYFYFTLIGLISLALVLTIFVKIKIQHPQIIINGLILIFIINTVLFLNSYLFAANGQVF
ncbi:MAG: CAP domain-containing protein [Candidatus Paceibacterota bacterium]